MVFPIWILSQSHVSKNFLDNIWYLFCSIIYYVCITLLLFSSHKNLQTSLSASKYFIRGLLEKEERLWYEGDLLCQQKIGCQAVLNLTGPILLLCSLGRMSFEKPSIHALMCLYVKAPTCYQEKDPKFK